MGQSASWASLAGGTFAGSFTPWRLIQGLSCSSKPPHAPIADTISYPDSYAVPRQCSLDPVVIISFDFAMQSLTIIVVITTSTAVLSILTIIVIISSESAHAK